MATESDPAMQLDTSIRSHNYYRNAVKKHWDPHEIDLEADREGIAELPEPAFEALKESLALFGAGEESVTEDLAPLAVVLEDIDDQMFLTTQLYEESKHTDFFDRYWREVVHAEEERRGQALSSPTDDRWFNDAYDELFERNERAMARLLEADTPENRAKAHCHYHLTIEGILAQTGYYGLTLAYGENEPELPDLPGLVEGLKLVRSDEGRHVGFGMAKLKSLVSDGDVEPDLLRETVGELVPLVQDSLVSDDGATSDSGPGPSPSQLSEYAYTKHEQRMQQITSASENIPDVEELTELEA
ncbi:ribonucleotide-diphosphate reductase subunit beta [Natronolimnohabitans innermongolicus]|uniref:Ribonucleotide reductase beta subunit-like protein n=1 Tax=Natronolimnohabitans innermongolicus JCM 12255 TaxID=1227499 RepID=L9WHQ5_9EURY|nr:ribonucleotide-diphosphate reductase subunit beta [Natronolimnohabitans innermongolicus]ELY48892.1 Ribonucleotide reductase beta subunit-like protein [Natronolimnohabitans innermongolicus JCM 12255]